MRRRKCRRYGAQCMKARCAQSRSPATDYALDLHRRFPHFALARCWRDDLTAAEHNQQLHVAITGLSEFRDLVSLPQDGGPVSEFEHATAFPGDFCRRDSDIGSRESTNLLCRLLWNECLRLDTRCKICRRAREARCGCRPGRLLAFYELESRGSRPTEAGRRSRQSHPWPPWRLYPHIAPSRIEQAGNLLAQSGITSRR